MKEKLYKATCLTAELYRLWRIERLRETYKKSHNEQIKQCITKQIQNLQKQIQNLEKERN